MHCSAWALAAAGLAQAAQAAQQQPQTILVVGDSLSAEYGLQRGQGWVALLGERLQADKKLASAWRVQNASISGDTTSGGRSRLSALLAQHRPALVVIELGANDALRGLSLAASKDNLAAMIKASQDAGARVLLVGMQMPPNYGAAYEREFEAMFTQAAQAAKIALVPFLLKGVADQPGAVQAGWFQADGIHPVAKAHPLILDNVWRELRPMLEAKTRR